MDELMLTSLSLGLLLGLSHALDADHIVAVGTLAAETESLKRSSLLGICWGVGHTVSLALIAVALPLIALARVLESLACALDVSTKPGDGLARGGEQRSPCSQQQKQPGPQFHTLFS